MDLYFFKAGRKNQKQQDWLPTGKGWERGRKKEGLEIG